MTGVHVVTAEGSSTDHSALVNCPPGQAATGGGGDAGAGQHLTFSGPVAGAGGKPVGWRVTTTDGRPTAFALCAPAS